MEKIKIGGSDQQYEIVSIMPQSVSVLQIIFADAVPDSWDGDIELYTAGDVLATTLSGYDTLCAVDGKTVYLSNDGQIHPVPEQPESNPETPYWMQMEQQVQILEEENTNLQLALTEQYEANLALQEELTNTQMALVELYEEGGGNDGSDLRNTDCER